MRAQSADFHRGAGELAAALRPQHDFRLDARQLEGAHYGEVACRDFRESVLAVMPHRRALPPPAPYPCQPRRRPAMRSGYITHVDQALRPNVAGCPPHALVADGRHAKTVWCGL